MTSPRQTIARETQKRISRSNCSAGSVAVTIQGLNRRNHFEIVWATRLSLTGGTLEYGKPELMISMLNADCSAAQSSVLFG